MDPECPLPLCVLLFHGFYNSRINSAPPSSFGTRPLYYTFFPISNMIRLFFCTISVPAEGGFWFRQETAAARQKDVDVLRHAWVRGTGNRAEQGPWPGRGLLGVGNTRLRTAGRNVSPSHHPSNGKEGRGNHKTCFPIELSSADLQTRFPSKMSHRPFPKAVSLQPNVSVTHRVLRALVKNKPGVESRLNN